MIIMLKQNPDKQEVEKLTMMLEKENVTINYVHGKFNDVIGLVGDTSHLDENTILASSEIVETVTRVSEPYKAVNRKFHPDDTCVNVNGAKIGGQNFGVIAGPCSVESEEQMIQVAKAVKDSGAKFLRGGAFKPRTSPYAFQGLHEEGIRLLLEAKKETGLPIVTEIMAISHLDLFNDVDVIQVGARNMQNFDLLKELGHSDKPILLKRGLSSTMEELLMSAEYILAGGNTNVILCERGIRTFEKATRNTLDLSAVPLLKSKTHLPVIVDPSHAAGIAALVEPLSKAAVSVGADGLMIEVHNNPKMARCDGDQSLTPKQFDHVMEKVKLLASIENKIM